MLNGANDVPKMVLYLFSFFKSFFFWISTQLFLPRAEWQFILCLAIVYAFLTVAVKTAILLGQGRLGANIM
jgi:hypothetical protein